METNEALKTVVWQEAEEELCKLLGQLHEVTRGDLKGLEEQVMQTAFAIGRGLLECILNWCESAEPAQARRVGSCGHGQRLVAERPKELLTLLGKVRLMRPYSQCVLVEKHVGSEPGEESQCTHGEAPADAHWGVHERRTTPGVQQTISALCASLTLEEAAATFSRLVP